MIHDLNDEWRVTTDAHNWILERMRKPGTKRDGSPSDPKWVPHAYCASLSQCVRRCCDEIARGSDTVPDALRELEDMANRIASIAEAVA